MRVGTKGWYTPPKHQAHAADGALVFKRKVIVFMKLVTFAKRSALVSWQAVTPQLMDRAVMWLR